MKYCMDKDIDKLVRRLVHQGWRFRRVAKHGRLTISEGTRTLTVAGSPSDCRSFRNFQRDGRRTVRIRALRRE